MSKPLRIRNVNDYARYIGAPVLHPLVSIIHYDELTTLRHSLNSYDVYGMFLNDGVLPELTYGTVQYNMPQHTLMCVAPGQIGGKTDTGEIIQASGWAILFDPELVHKTFLGKQMSRYRFFSYNVSEPLLMTDEERQVMVDCLEHIRTELRAHCDEEHQLPIIASWLSLLLESCLRFYSRQFKIQSTGEHGLLHRLEDLLNTYYTQGQQLQNGLPTVRYCASQLCLSAGYFGDLMRETTGMTAINYIHRFVILRANEQLRSGKSISETAYALGFQNPALFSRTYKKIASISPSAFR